MDPRVPATVLASYSSRSRVLRDRVAPLLEHFIDDDLDAGIVELDALVDFLLLDRGQHQADHAEAILLAGLHRGLHVVGKLGLQAHVLLRGNRWCQDGIVHEERLEKYLGVKQGSVTPFALMNDTEHAVEFFIDKNLSRCKSMGIHPLENTATVFISFKDLDKFLWNLDVDVVKIKL